MDNYYEKQFMKKDQSLRIPEKANMQEYIERLEAIVKRWWCEEIVLQVPLLPTYCCGILETFWGTVQPQGFSCAQFFCCGPNPARIF